LVDHASKEESIGLGQVLDRVTMQLFVRDPYTMIAAAVQSDVDGISKWSHYALSAADGVPQETMPFMPVALTPPMLARFARGSLSVACRALESPGFEDANYANFLVALSAATLVRP